ncbi:MAG: hypothetical protein K0R23_3599, partial [Lacrimispora sp.]|nr:hypothetical protein [Lacrimispora sp.]
MSQKKQMPIEGSKKQMGKITGKNSIKRKLQISIAALSTVITLLFGTVNSII